MFSLIVLLEQLTTLELKRREEKSIEKRLKWAQFPFYKTLNELTIFSFRATTKSIV